MLIGRLLDQVVQDGSLVKFRRQYHVKVTKTGDPKLYAKMQKIVATEPERIVTQETYSKIINMGDRITRSPFYKWYKKNKAQFQVPLHRSTSSWFKTATELTKIQPFDVCGLIDMLTIKGDTAYVDDLKTTKTSSMRTAQSWFWKCQDMGYFRQMGLYRWLVQQAHPEVKNFICRHVVISNEKADIHPIKLFLIPQSLLDQGLKEFFEVATQIAIEERFIDELPDWDSIEKLPEAIASASTGPVELDGEELEETS